MQGIPDGLIHVAEVKGVGMVGLVACDAMLADKDTIDNDEQQHQRPCETPLAFQGAQRIARNAAATGHCWRIVWRWRGVRRSMESS